MPKEKPLDLSVYQGYNFKKSEQKPVGFITKLKIGDKELAADQKVKNTLEPEKELAVVGVLRQIHWDTGVTDPLSFGMCVSTKNKQNIKLLRLKDMVKVDVTFQFKAFDFDTDPNQQQYFMCFHGNDTDLKGVVLKQGGELVLDILDFADTEVNQPENFFFNIGIEPKGEQTLHLATSADGKAAKQWGMNVQG